MIYLMMIESQEDKDKFEILYEKYRYMMYSSANDVLKDAYLAEDVVHDSFVKIARNMHKIGEVDDKETKNFIMTITKNTALDAYRKRAKSMEQELFVTDIDESESVYEVSSDYSVEEEVFGESEIISILRGMKDSYKYIFLLKYVNGLENKEIADILNITEEVVRKRISRGKSIIEKELEGKRKQ